MTTVIEKRCPECNQALLVRRTNRTTGHDFWGCERWPECGHTEPLPEYVRLREAGAAPLPGFE